MYNTMSYNNNHNNNHEDQKESFAGIFEIDGLLQSVNFDDDYGFYEDLDSVEDNYPRSAASEIDDNACQPFDRIVDQQEALDVSPPILNSYMVEQIVDEGLPWSMQDMKWDRIFSSTRDGPSFGAFMRKVRGREKTIVVAKAPDGTIVGGYATEPWSGKKKSSESDSNSNHHGFIFSIKPSEKNTASPLTQRSSSRAVASFIPGLKGNSPTSSLDFDLASKLSMMPDAIESDGNHVDIIRQSNGTDFKQVCQLSNKLIAMGDGQEASFSFEGSFSRVSASISSASCDEFEIVQFEVYGFSEE